MADVINIADARAAREQRRSLVVSLLALGLLVALCAFAGSDK